jgi:hypothetical protein
MLMARDIRYYPGYDHIYAEPRPGGGINAADVALIIHTELPDGRAAALSLIIDTGVFPASIPDNHWSPAGFWGDPQWHHRLRFSDLSLHCQPSVSGTGQSCDILRATLGARRACIVAYTTALGATDLVRQAGLIGKEDHDAPPAAFDPSNPPEALWKALEAKLDELISARAYLREA